MRQSSVDARRFPVRSLVRTASSVALAFSLAVPAFAQDATPAAPAAPPAPPAAAQPQGMTEAVVAHVNDEVITNYDIIQRMRLIMVTAGIQPTQNDMAQLQQYALSSLIDERLEMQELRREEKEQKITIIATDSVVDDALNDMAHDAHMTGPQMLSALGQQGVGPETLRAQLRAELSWRDWIRGRYGSQVMVGEDQIHAFQQRVAAEASKPKYQISEVYIDVQKAGGMDQAMAEANQLVAQLHQGAPFAAVARQFSAAPTAANGGDAGWVTAGELEPEVQAALADTRPGTLAGPIQTRDGVYIINLRDKQAGGSSLLISLKQAAIPLPVDAPADAVSAAMAKLTALRSQLHGCDNFETIAGHVDGVVAGDLGEAQAHDLAPAFRDAAMQMPIGQVSDPIRSDQGLHLIVVCGRRSNAAEGLDHDQIQNRLIGERLEMINKRSIRDLRNSASIEVRQSS
jgi:peptidyl-prolyl cis-trans isomerase SurA